MEATFETVAYLTKEEILQINRQTVLEFGGRFVYEFNNVSEPDRLEYILEAVKGSILTFEVYQTVFAKAAVYAFSIIQDNVFYDGNKRTGLESAIAFMGRNGYVIKDSVPHEEIVSLGLGIATGRINLEGTTDWFTVNTVEG